MSEDARQLAESRGRRAESAAAWLLRCKGYAVLARRERSAFGEIDLIVRRGRCLAAVEVKARPGLLRLDELVGERQWQRIQRALESFAARRRLHTLRFRYDVVVVRPRRLPRHIVDAWRPF